MVSPRAGLDAVAKRKILCSCWEWNPGRPARSLVTILTELYRLTQGSHTHVVIDG